MVFGEQRDRLVFGHVFGDMGQQDRVEAAGRLYSAERRNSAGVNAISPRALAARTQCSLVSTPTLCPRRC